MLRQQSLTSSLGTPTWEVAHLFPDQGRWTETEFFELHSNRMVELADGYLEILPMPTWLHQLMVKFLVRAVEEAIGNKGAVLDAPLPIRLFTDTIREPDVMYFAPGSEPADPRSYPTKVDLAMEVVSEGTEARRRDYEDKRRDYARAGVSEYWIVDPDDRKIVVLVLQNGTYQTHGEFAIGDKAAGVLIPDLKIDVAEIMKLGDSPL
ncbi:MAG: Uma2 family endonuclease [Planctomycetaceae bacterium]